MKGLFGDFCFPTTDKVSSEDVSVTADEHKGAEGWKASSQDRNDVHQSQALVDKASRVKW